LFCLPKLAQGLARADAHVRLAPDPRRLFWRHMGVAKARTAGRPCGLCPLKVRRLREGRVPASERVSATLKGGAEKTNRARPINPFFTMAAFTIAKP